MVCYEAIGSAGKAETPGTGSAFVSAFCYSLGSSFTLLSSFVSFSYTFASGSIPATSCFGFGVGIAF